MGSLTISLLCFVGIFCAALIGMSIRKVLPEHHLSETTWDSIKIGTGLIATLTALVLGLLVNSAKNAYDTINEEISQGGAKVILLDRVLSRYGPEASAVRAELRHVLTTGLAAGHPKGSGARSGVAPLERKAGIEDVQDMVRRLSPQNDYQKSVQAQASGLVAELTQARWFVFQQLHAPLPKAFLVILMLWLTVFFMCFGLLSEANATVVAVILVCALSVSGAIFLILEMNHPLEGVIKVSLEPLRYAASQLGQ